MTIPPGTTVSVHPTGRAELLTILFDPALIHTPALPVLGRAEGYYDVLYGVCETRSALTSLAALLADDIVRQPADGRYACRNSLLVAVLEYLVTTPDLVTRVGTPTPFVIGGLARARAAIEESLSEPITLSGIAARAGISPYHLSRSFRSCHGVSFGAYVRQRRVEAACRLLAETDRPLAQIAYECGFCSQSGMNVAFRHVLNTTPLSYRRACRRQLG